MRDDRERLSRDRQDQAPRPDRDPEVPWRVITDMRNRVSHGYFDIDLDVVWNTVTRDLSKLQESVTRIVAELDSEAEDSR